MQNPVCLLFKFRKIVFVFTPELSTGKLLWTFELIGHFFPVICSSKTYCFWWENYTYIMALWLDCTIKSKNTIINVWGNRWLKYEYMTTAICNTIIFRILVLLHKRSVWDRGGTLLTIHIARFCMTAILFKAPLFISVRSLKNLMATFHFHCIKFCKDVQNKRVWRRMLMKEY